MLKKIFSILLSIAFISANTGYAASNQKRDISHLRVPLTATKRVEKVLNAKQVTIRGNFLTDPDVIEEALAEKSKVNTLIAENKDNVEWMAAREIADLIKSKNAKGEKIVVSFATGGTYEGVYKKLIEITKREGISWQNVVTFNLDEYAWNAYGYNNGYRAQYYDRESYQAFMRDNLFTWLKENAGLQENNIYFMGGLTEYPRKEANDYEDLIMKETDGKGADLQVLGIGVEGHIAFIEARPGMPLKDFLNISTRVEKLSDSTRKANSRFFDNNIDAVPPYAMTQGISTILKAKEILLVATGPAKADAIFKTVINKVTPAVPASVLQIHPNAKIIVDKDAAKNLIELTIQDSRQGAVRTAINPFLLFETGKDRGNLTIDKKTIFIGMGGGDTAGLNDFVANTVERLTKLGYKVIGIRNGFKGLLKGAKLEDNLVELTPRIAASMKGLPSIVLGSCREKLKEEDITKIVDILKPSAGAIFIGGNDHLKNVGQVADEAGKQGIDITVVGVPKSIDNDFMTVMHGFWSAVIAGRQTVARASINPKEGKGLTTAAVFECMGRKSGSLTLELSKGCPSSHVVIVPEKPVTIDDIINASDKGIRNFFVSEGFSLSEADPKLSQLLEAYPVLKTMWEKSRTSPDRDAHGNPKLTGASLFVKGVLEHFCGLKVEKTDLTYQLRGAFLQPDNKGIVFDTFLAGKFAEKAVSLVDTKQSGFAVTYSGEYGDTEGMIEAKPPKDVYQSRDLSTMLSDKSLADLGVLGVSGYQINYNAIPELFSDKKVVLEAAMREAFYSIAVSTQAHRYASVAELREPSDAIVSSCGKDQDNPDKLPNGLRTVIEGTRESVLLLIPEKQATLSQIADRAKDICDKSGYLNIAISKDFMLDPKDELLESVLNTDPVLRIKFNKEGIADDKTGMVRFESGVSNFIVGLYKYLIKQGKIKVEGTKITDLGYAFKGLARASALDSINREALNSGV